MILSIYFFLLTCFTFCTLGKLHGDVVNCTTDANSYAANKQQKVKHSSTQKMICLSVIPVVVFVVPAYHPVRPPQVACPLSILSLSNIPSPTTVPICCLSLARFLSTRFIDETWG